MGIYGEKRKMQGCGLCGKDMILRYSPKNDSFFVGCTGFPGCRNTSRLRIDDVINYLLLTEQYLNELIAEISTLHHDGSGTLEEVELSAREAKEHTEKERLTVQGLNARFFPPRMRAINEAERIIMECRDE